MVDRSTAAPSSFLQTTTRTNESTPSLRTAPPSAVTLTAAPPAAAATVRKSQPFWLGGAASMGAACCTHPLDLLKVRQQLQTAASAAAATAAAAPSSTGAPLRPAVAPVAREGMLRLASGIVRQEGVLALYAGLSASLLRQASYSTVRFGVYEGLKQRRLDQLALLATRGGAAAAAAAAAKRPTDLPMLDSIAFSLFGGAIGGVVGNPADLVNVRMQNDKKLDVSCRRNYKNVFSALAVVARSEGVPALWNGVGPNIARAMLMTSGQLASYDLFKSALVTRVGMDQNKIHTHLTASCLAGVVATVLTQPVDVLKTRAMNASKIATAALSSSSSSSSSSSATVGGAGCAPSAPSTMTIARDMLRVEGAGAFFKGFVPALTRLGPHTIATFLFLEQLKKITT